MCKKFLYLFFLFIAIGITACHNNPPAILKPSSSADSQKKKKTGRIEFSEEIHNFGSLKEGEIVSFSFKFKNLGESPLRLRKVEPTCGCLTVRYDKEDVGAAQSSFIEVIFNTEGEWGNQVKTVEVETSEGQVKTLTIGAFVENKNINVDLNK
jgi:hypothetical protein